MSDEFPTPAVGAAVADEFVRAALRWHFDPQTGSPYWLKRADSLGFDPLTDINGWSDLGRFPDISEEWRDTPARDLLPAGCRAASPAASPTAAPVQVFDSGGTTGRPKRIIEATSRREGVDWVSGVLERHGIPGEGAGDWLHIGPTGPHIVGRSIGLLAALRGELCHFIDLDPRWVKRCIAEGRRQEAARYLEHILDQAADVLSSQPVAVVFITPVVLEAVAARPALLDLFSAKVKGIVWAGTSISPETRYLLEHEVFPGIPLVGLYGNTLAGIAPQRPRVADDTHDCVFLPYHPYSRIEVVDPQDPTALVPYGERGQIRLTLLTRDLFLPYALERDSAIRVAPTEDFPWDALADVQPLTRGADAPVEGVY
ncbi:phenazine biosynthesis protein [Streptomyces sp. NBC_01262]|uniref:phenazine biosynthesis protein n=1 Tax=Streptomyces sp. NBC_01262 TaxID=2903803 RepID=UPI002E34B92D|nr:phenazine biosynthesis protein [Streptomyces sp. NBC_01262]